MTASYHEGKNAMAVAAPRQEVDPASSPTEVNASEDSRDKDPHRRTTDRILAHWKRIRVDDASLPSLAELALGAYPEIREESFLLREDRDPAASVFILCGGNVADALGVDPVGLTLESVLAKRIEARLAQACREALREKRPVRAEGTYRSEDGEETRYRAIFMPARSIGKLDDGYVFGTFGQKTIPSRAA